MRHSFQQDSIVSVYKFQISSLVDESIMKSW